MFFRDLRGMEIGEAKDLGEVSPGLLQSITRAPNGWIWTSMTAVGVSSVFVPEKRFRKRVQEGEAPN